MLQSMGSQRAMRDLVTEQDVVAGQGLSLVAVSRGYFLVVACGLPIEAGSLPAQHGLQGLQQLQLVVMGSVVSHGLCCPTACGIFLDLGWNLCPLHWQANS